jgi:hypothetical protein
MPRQKLTQRTDGYFKVKYHDKQFYGKTQAEAMKARDAYKQKEQMGLSHDLEGITFLDYALNWKFTAPIAACRCRSNMPA